MHANEIANEGDILFRSIDDIALFTSENEFDPFIFISEGGVVKEERVELDEFHSKIIKFTDPRAIDILTDIPCDRGMPAFMSSYQLMRVYSRILYMLKTDSVYREKFNHDAHNQYVIHRMGDVQSAQIINAIIRNAKIAIDFGIADTAKSLLTESGKQTLLEISNLRKIDVPSPSELELGENS